MKPQRNYENYHQRNIFSLTGRIAHLIETNPDSLKLMNKMFQQIAK